MSSIYLVALGGVGSKLTYYMYDLKLMAPKNILEKIGVEIRKAKTIDPRIETQIFDMAEEQIHEYLRKDFNLSDDNIRIIYYPDPEKYKIPRIISEATSSGYKNLLRYFPFWSSYLTNLGPKRGVKRYRPLARYFISNIIDEIERVIIDDFIRDFGREQGPSLSVFVVSAGGGFGSGSLLTIGSIIKHRTMGASGTEGRSKTQLFVHLPVGSRYRLKPSDAPRGIDNAYASMGALILELMYLHELFKQTMNYYTDNLTNKINTMLGYSEENKFRLYPFDNIVITTLKNIYLRNPAKLREIDDEFWLHDNLFATIILSTIVGTIQHGDRIIDILADNPEINTYYSTIDEIISSIRVDQETIGLPYSIFLPVDTYTISFIKLDKKKISSEINNIISLYDNKIKLINDKENILKEREMLKEKKKQLEDLLDKIDMKIAEYESYRELVRRDTEELIIDQSTKNYILEVDTLRGQLEKLKNLMNYLSKNDNLNEINRGLEIILSSRSKEGLQELESKFTGGPLHKLYQETKLKYRDIDNLKIEELNIKELLELDIKRVFEYYYIINRLNINIKVNIMTNISSIEKFANEIRDKAVQKKGRIFCGTACAVINKVDRITEILSSIKSYINALTKQIENDLQVLDEKIKIYGKKLKEYRENIKDEQESIIKQIQEKTIQIKLIEHELKENEIRTKKQIIEFIRNFENDLARSGLIMPINYDLIVNKIYKNEESVNKIIDFFKKLPEKQENILEFSIDKFIELISMISEEQSEIIVDRLTEELINKSRLWHLTIDDPDTFITNLKNTINKISRSTEASASNKSIMITNKDPFVELRKIMMKEKIYIIYTEDNLKLAKRILTMLSPILAERVELVDRIIQGHEVKDDNIGTLPIAVKVESDESTFIAVLRKKMNIPIGSIKEVRTVLKYALEKDIVEKCYEYDTHLNKCMKRRREPEYRALKFTTLDIEDERYMNFMKQIEQVILELEERVIK